MTFPPSKELLRDLRACACVFRSQQDAILYETGKCVHQRAANRIAELEAQLVALVDLAVGVAVDARDAFAKVGKDRESNACDYLVGALGSLTSEDARVSFEAAKIAAIEPCEGRFVEHRFWQRLGERGVSSPSVSSRSTESRVSFGSASTTFATCSHTSLRAMILQNLSTSAR